MYMWLDVKPKHTILVLACAWGLGPLPPAGSVAQRRRSPGQRPGGVCGTAPRDCAKEIWEPFETKDWVPSQSAARNEEFYNRNEENQPGSDK